MSYQILIGDAREQLATIPDGTVQTCVTSPPYYGLRDYGTASWNGGDPDCDHKRPVQARNDRPKGAFHGGTDEGDYAREPQYKGTCGKCGAVRVDRQIGLEATVDAYVQALVDVFREVRRVLKDDGTLWLNLGDSYNSGAQFNHGRSGGKQAYTEATIADEWPGHRPMLDGLKPKDLIGIPWRVAFALQSDGWYLRSEIIWSKSNPMPESVTDRPTKAHETVFLLSKQPRYFYDAAAIAEPATQHEQGIRGNHDGQKMPPETSNGRNGSTLKDADRTSRNKRSVWTISTQPYSGAHFAVFPPKLIEPCILAGTSERGQCRACGAPWVRVVERTVERNWKECPKDEGRRSQGLQSSKSGLHSQYHEVTSTPKGWAPSCACDAGPPIPQTVLDPFAGSGTTGEVAEVHGRHAVLIELNPEYRPLIERRLAQRPLWDAMSVAD